MRTATVTVFNDSAIKYVPLKKIRSAVLAVLNGESIQVANIRVILVDDVRLHRMNVDFLGHDYPTDVITFPLEEEPLEGEVYISVERAAEQAMEFNVSKTSELMRLAAHGALHLAGYEDNTEEKRRIMHELETRYIT